MNRLSPVAEAYALDAPQIELGRSVYEPPCCPDCGRRVRSMEWDGRCRRCGTGEDEPVPDVAAALAPIMAADWSKVEVDMIPLIVNRGGR
jgi:hypothetical protein